MLYAILSDIHANESALKLALADARACGAEEIVCLGDVVGYGPLPAETLRLVRESCSVVVAGNHDDAVSERMPADDFIDLAADAVVRHQRALSRDELEWLRQLPYTAEIDGATLVHGELADSPAFYYLDTEEAAVTNFSLMSAPLLFCGHTHVPLVHVMSPDGTVASHAATDFVLVRDFQYIVNPGSIGYPRERDGRCESTYVLYDSTSHNIRYRRLPFAVSSVMQRGSASGRSLKFRWLAILAAAAIAIASALAFLLSGPSAPANVPDTPALETLTATIGAAHQKLTPNLNLKSGSAPALLRITFTAEDGQPVGVRTYTVKRRLNRAVSVPARAAAARLELFPLPSEAPPSVDSFAPFAH